MKTTKLRIPGVSLSGETSSELARPGNGMGVRVRESGVWRLGRSRGGEGVVEREFRDDEVLELELEGGLRLWTSFGQFRRDFPVEGPAVRAGDGEGGGEEWFPGELAVDGRRRGPGRVGIEVLRVLEVDLAGLTAAGVARMIEGRLPGGPGFFRCSGDEGLRLEAAGAADVAGEKPVLVFLHGTASSTAGSFGGLWEPEQRAARKELFEFYGGRVFALEHRTLTASPVENAVELLRALPKGARLHLVSHSRGGLVGELVGLWGRRGERGFDPLAPEVIESLFEDAVVDGQKLDRASERRALGQLRELLAEKRPVVERFVRVACPARGTTLASGRLDRWMSMFVNALSLAGGTAGSAMAMAGDFLLAVAKERTDPRTLPGLEAQMPESPLVALLNHPAYAVPGDLTVIAGDVEAGGWAGRLGLMLVDRFYEEDHDWIVNSRAMYGGARRDGAVHYFFDQGAHVSHFRYFRNASTVQRLVTGLLRRSGFEEEFAELPVEWRTAEREILRGGARRARGVTGELPVVFVLPGIMGSHLAVNGQRIWLDPLELALGGLAELTIDRKGVTAEGALGMVYGELVEFLEERGHEVVVFPYDWRKSMTEEAGRLGKAVRERLDATVAAGLPVRIIAHSMGGLVARAMFGADGNLWRHFMGRSGARFVMLGTPNAGSFVIPQLLLGRESTVRLLERLDWKHSMAEMLMVISRFPGVLELLPGTGEAGGGLDFFGEEFWSEALAAEPDGVWQAPALEALEAARKTREGVAAGPVNGECMVYVAGRAEETPCGLEIVEREGGRKEIRFLATARGDGKAPWDTSVPAGVRAFLSEVGHADLPACRGAFRAYHELLLTGTTDELPALAAAERGGMARGLVRSVLDQPMGVFPAANEVAGAVLGVARRTNRPKVQPTVTVTVAHGDLAFTKNVVMVGHYKGDSIVSAERRLDSLLGGRLQERDRLAMYPGDLGTTAVFLQPGGEPGGAVVIGLGEVGSLGAGELAQAVTHGLVRLAVAVAETPAVCGREAAGKERLSVSTLLIGTGQGGVTLEDSVKAILEGVEGAEAVLERGKLRSQVTVGAVEFIELNEDLAIAAARVLADLERDPRWQRRFKIGERMRKLPGGRTRAAAEDAGGWWDRLRIAADEAGTGALYYDLPTNRARAEVEVVPTQRALLDQFVERCITNVSPDASTAQTLFELLVPGELKDVASARRDLVLVLDEESARYPWELLENRRDAAGRPLAVAAGMVRQLRLADERRRAVVVNAVETNALVVGDPVSDFEPLPGAEQEAKAVAGALQTRGYAVELLVRRDAAEVVAKLFERPYRIVHLAGHGVYNEEFELPGSGGGMRRVRVTGMVLGKGVFLTPAEVAQMRQVPELVFLNCCHLGRIEDRERGGIRQSNRLAANLAGEFIASGVRAVVAAGWAVDDAAGTTFAEEFYAGMLRGLRFGVAVRVARERTFERHPGVNTWGAYQCYGDPMFALRMEGGEEAARAVRRLVHEREVVVEADNLAGDAVRARGGKELQRLAERLRQLVKRVPADWLEQGEVAAGLGYAFAELRCFEEAVEYYGRAVECEDGGAGVWVWEQLSNLEARRAVEMVQRDAGARAAALELVARAKARLEGLLKLGETAERFSALASVEKRCAWLTRGRERAAALARMTAGYGRAVQLTGETEVSARAYAMANWLLGRVLTEGRGRSRRTELRKEIKRWEEAMREKMVAEEAERPTFWTLANVAYGRLLRELMAGDLKQSGKRIMELYRRAMERGATERQKISVRENLEFIAVVLGARRGGKKLAAEVGGIAQALDG